MKTFVRNTIAGKWAALAGAAILCATAARAQYVSTVVTNLYSPNDIAVDPNGIAYITDAGSNAIIAYVPTTGASSIFVGSPGLTGTNNGLGGLARFNDPSGILYVPSLGGLVVADENNQDLRLVTLSGVVSTLAGRPGVMGNANGAATSATFEFPTSLALDASGTNLYIADSGNNDIRVLTTGNLQVSTLQVANYTFKYPQGLSVDANNNLWVADTKNDVIVVISNVNPNAVNSATVVAGAKGFAGSTDDAYNAANARFSSPTSVLWDSDVGGLLVADTGNNTIREIYQTNGAWATRLMAGTAGTSGVNNGVPATATFNQPTGLAVDSYDFGFYIVDRGNGVVRALQPSAPEPQVSAPVFGFVTFPPVGSPPLLLSVFTVSSNAMLDNFDPPRIAIQSEAGTETYITYGATPSDPLQNSIPTPSPETGISPETYRGDGLTESQSAPSIISPLPDVTLYAISYAPGRRPSPVVSARFKFAVDNPVIDGLNAESVTLSDTTSNALIYYTLDGSIPDDGGTNAASIGPVSSGETLSFNIATNTTINVRAFRAGFAPSGVSTETLLLGNQVFNELTLGFPTGQKASSVFRATQGEHFVAPVTLTLLPSAEMYTLQFNVTVTNIVPAPVPTDPAGYQFGFASMLEMPITNGFFATIPPEMFVGGTTFVNGQFTNSTENLLGVGWVETLNKTNLYPAGSQDLIAYSHAQDDQFVQSSGKVVVGGYSFVVPTNSQIGNLYQVQLGRPSASADGIGELASPLQAPTNGSFTVGTINAIKDITVAAGGIGTNQLSYLVGDVNAFHWFNIGDFGDGNLDASDVEEVFKSAVYNLNIPVTNSALYDAMDSANVTASSDPALFSADGATINSSINSMLVGDGQLNIADVFVTFRRSLDPSLLWVRRYYDTHGTLIATNVPNGPSLENMRPVSRPPSLAGAKTPLPAGSSVTHTISLAADQIVASASTVVVPLRVTAADPAGLPIRYLMFDAQIQPLDGSPGITSPVTFTPASTLGAPTTTLSQGPQDIACLWMSTNSPGFSGTGVLGTISFALPAGVNPSSSYLVSVQKFSASPTGLGLFTASVQNGLVTLSDRSGSSWSDGIPDSWRLVHFGTISNPDSAATADPDGDGASNWQEYIAGTDPLSAASVFKLQAAPATANVFTLQWPSVVGKTYTLQSAASLTSGWTTLTNVSGTGATMSWPDASTSAQAKFYRATVQ